MTDYISPDNNSDNPAEELYPSFVKIEEISTATDKIDHSGIYVLPSIKTRYFSMFIDVIVITILSLGISFLFDQFNHVPDFFRGLLFMLIFFLYEPILVSFGSTVGQMLTEIRVRKFENPEEKQLFPLLLIRFFVKIFLGWLSFLTVTFNINRRAIHDFASGSIMIANKTEK